MKIALLGLGRMGQALGQRLLDGGHDLTVWNRSPGKAGELVERGATDFEAREDAIAPAEVVLSSLSNDDAVRELALEENGIRSVLGERTYADTSTISPRLSAELGRSFDRFVALPVLGAPTAVRSGDATYLAGGTKETIERIQPVLASLSDNVKRYPRPELASTAKLAVNLLLLAGVVALAEAMAVARAGGLDDEQITDLLSASPMVAPGLKNRFEGVRDGAGPTWWTVTLGAKDAGLAEEVAADGGVDLLLTPSVWETYRAAAEGGYADEDIVAVSRLYRRP